MNKEKDHIEYLQNVLTTWKAFCKSHRIFAEMLRKMLDENKALKETLKEVKNNECKFG